MSCFVNIFKAHMISSNITLYNKINMDINKYVNAVIWHMLYIFVCDLLQIRTVQPIIILKDCHGSKLTELYYKMFPVSQC